MKQMLYQLKIILTEKQRKGLFFLFLGAVFNASLDTIAVALMAPFMSVLTNLGGFEESAIGIVMAAYFNVNSKEQALIILSAGFILLYLVRGISKIIYNSVQARMMADYRTDLSIRLFSFIMNKPYSFHLKHNTSETQRLVNGDVHNCFAALNSLLSTMSCLFVSSGIFAVLLFMNWKLTMLLLIIVAFFVVWAKRVLKNIIKRYADMSYTANGEIYKWVSQAIGGLKNILVKHREAYYVDQYSFYAKNAAKANSNYIAIDLMPKVLIDTACMVLVFATVLIEVLVGNDINSSLPMFATFALAAMRLIPVANSLTSTMNQLSFYRPSLDAVISMMENGQVEANVDARILAAEESKAGLDEHKVLTKGIELFDISFKYDDAETWLYNDLNLYIPARKSVAFIGTTGSGKTTLADIILGLHKPLTGKVLADGIDISENSIWWSTMLGYIPQFVYLSDDTIRANVALGEKREAIDDVWVWSCLEKAHMKEFVESLPDGLDTVTGENGVRLSGGQRQRIGIARALYCKPQFLVMDEATSSLDGETEKMIVESINAISKDITILIIAHRLSTIENCDMVYRIEDGKSILERTEKLSQ